MTRPVRRLLAGLLSLALLSACGVAPTATPQPTATPTAVPPTRTPVPSSTPEPVTDATVPLPTALPLPSPALASSGTMETYHNPLFGVALRYPGDWQPLEGYERRFGGVDGFFQLDAMAAAGRSIDQVARAEAEHMLQPYGSSPAIEALQVEGQEARLIMPSADQPREMKGQAALLIAAPRTIEIAGDRYDYIILWCDRPHMRAIMDSIELTTGRPEEVQVVLSALALQHHVAPDAIRLQKWELVDWPDGCLGVPRRDPCVEAVVRGYRVQVRISGELYEYRTDLSGQHLVLAAGPDPGIDNPALVWEGEDSGCQSLRLAPDGRAAIGPCDSPQVRLHLLKETQRPQEWAELQQRFAPFEADTPWGLVQFRGQGKEVATPARERAIAAWARLVHTELLFGRSGASWGVAVNWRRPSDRPEFCEFLHVENYGMAFASRARCEGGDVENLGQAWLTDDELERLDAWYYNRQLISRTDLYFAGVGKERPSPKEIDQLRDWAAGVYERLYD